MPRYKAAIQVDFLIDLEGHPQWEILHTDAARLVSRQVVAWFKSGPMTSAAVVGMGEDSVAARFVQYTAHNPEVTEVGAEVDGSTNKGPEWELVRKA